jgi:hypothetical protein
MKQIIIKQFESIFFIMDAPQILSLILTFLSSLIAIFVWVKMWKYIRGELKTAPEYHRMQRLRNTGSAIIFSTMVAFSVAFVIALISSTMASNAIITLLRFPTDTFWTVELLAAFQFPVFIPATLAIITIFAFFYPFYEYLLLAQPSQEGPMEIQRYLETKFIDRFSPPWSYGAAMIQIVVIVILTPLITSLIAVKTWDYPPAISTGWVIGLIFMVWVLLGPIFYLNYYGNIGVTQAYFRGRRVEYKKDKKTKIFYYFAVFIIISSVYSFIKYVSILWGEFPTPDYLKSLEDQSGFIKSLVDVIKFINPDVTIEELRPTIVFFSIVPVDFLWFIVTTMGFGLYGFYSKFISKEPLNSGKMVLFAAYIICGIAFNIFINIIIQWPWVFPDQALPLLGLNLNLQNPLHSNTIIRIFATAILVSKTITIMFLVNNLFLNKEYKQNATEWVLNRAISENDFDTILVYATAKESETRKLVADSVIHFVSITEKGAISSETSQNITIIIDHLLTDHDPELADYMRKNYDKVILKLGNEALLEGLTKLLQSTEKSKIRQARSVLQQISKEDTDQLFYLNRNLIRADISPRALTEIFDLLQSVDETEHQIVSELVCPFLTPQIAHSQQYLVLAILYLIKRRIQSFKADCTNLAPLLTELLHHPDPTIVSHSLDVYSSLAAANPELITDVMIEFNKIDMTESEVIRQKIGAVVKFCLAKPDWFSQLFEYIEIYLKQDRSNMKSDAALTLGSLSQIISEQTFFEKIYPYFRLLVNDENLAIKQATVSSLIVIAKTRPEIFQAERFQHLFSVLVIDPHVEIRHQIYRFFVQGNPKYLLNDIAAILSMPLSVAIRVDLLNTLSSIAEKIAPSIDELQLISILINQKFVSSELLRAMDIDALQADKSRIFGFKRNVDSISVIEATVALLYELCYYSPHHYPEVKQFLEVNTIKAGSLATAKLFEFHCRFALDALIRNSSNPLGITVETTLQLLRNQMYVVHALGQKIISDFISQVYAHSPRFHLEIIEILNALTKQRDVPESFTRKTILEVFAKVISDNSDLYFSPYELKNLLTSKAETINPFEVRFKPYLQQSMKLQDEQVQQGVANALYSILETTGQEKLVRALLFKAIATKHPTTKVTAMKAIISLPIQLDDKPTTGILLKQLGSKDEAVKAQAIHSLGAIIRTFPTIPERGHSPHRKRVKSLVYRTLFDPYHPGAPLSVKQAIVDQLGTIALVQPNLPLCLTIIDRIGLDPSISIAKKAVETFFNYIDLYPTRLNQDLMVIFRHLVNSPSSEINEMLVNKLIELHAAGERLERLIPSLLTLASSSDQSIRNQSMHAFQEIYLGDPATFDYCLSLIAKLARNRQTGIRQDVAELVTRVLLEQSDKLQDNISIFVILQDLARDPEYIIGFAIAENLSSIMPKYPTRTNDFLNIIYILLRKTTKSRVNITKHLVISLQALARGSPEYIPSLIRSLERFYRKSNEIQLHALIEKLKAQI